MANFLNKIVYINLDKRYDRKLHTETQNEKYGIDAIRFKAFEYPGQGIVGCGYSHLGVLKMAKENQWKNVLIMEDDFEFLVSPEEFWKNITQLFESKIRFDVCMLSYNLHEQEPVNDLVFRVKYAQTASAYIVNQHYYDALIELYQKNIPILESTGIHWVYANDVCWRELQQRDMWLGFTTRIGKQLDGFSDNANCVVNYNC